MIMLQIKAAVLSVLALVHTGTLQTAKQPVTNQKKITQEVKVGKGELAKRNKIKGFIKLVKPKYSDSYIAKIVDAIFRYGKKYNVEPYVIVSTAYVESEFSMSSRPCIGIMQILKSTLRYLNPKNQYNPYTIDGNIALGAKELSQHLHGDVNRGSTLDRSASTNRRLRYMWGRYNGAGTSSKYSYKTLKVIHTLAFSDLHAIQSKLRKGPIWR